MTDDLVREARRRLSEGTPLEQVRTDFERRGVRDAVIEEVLSEAQGSDVSGNSSGRADGFTERRPLVVALLSLTVVYFIYWFYDTNVELKQVLDDGSHPLLRTIGWLSAPFLLLIPWFITEWKHAHSVKRATGRTNPLLVWILYSLFFPAAPYLIQQALNEGPNGERT